MPELADLLKLCDGLPVVGDHVRRSREQVDVDAIAAQLNIDAIIARIDLIGLANEIIGGVDLPAIIRVSTNTVTAEVMTDVRTQGQRADDVVSSFVDRMLGRDQAPT
ncbi:MAG: hypothetical protein M3O32_10755 [Actinomycetota bacterium]|nr:hypothetical protein [Actinomycetota bacterium]